MKIRAALGQKIWVPEGTTGRSTHPGHSLIIVTAGTLTAYEVNDPARKPSVCTKGMTFVIAELF